MSAPPTTSPATLNPQTPTTLLQTETSSPQTLVTTPQIESPTPQPPSIKTPPQQRPFFALVQAHLVCCCPEHHISSHAKICVRINPGKTDEENVAFMRSLLFVSKDDTCYFEDQAGNCIIPDYNGLKDCHGKQRVRIQMFIERRGTEHINRLERANTSRGFAIFEDATTEGWVSSISRKDFDFDECQCEQCMFRQEKSRFADHLDSSEESGDESDSEDDVAAIPPTAAPAARQDQQEVSPNDEEVDQRSAATPEDAREAGEEGRDDNAPADGYETESEDGRDESGRAEFLYGRVIAGASSSGVPLDYTLRQWGLLSPAPRGPRKVTWDAAAEDLRRMR